MSPDQFIDPEILKLKLGCGVKIGLDDSLRAALSGATFGLNIFSMKVTLLIPTMNEIDGVKVMMPQIQRNWVDEILIVDGGSDGTFEYAVEQGYRVLKQKSKSLVGAYREGVAAAIGDAILTFSSDGNSVPALIPLLVTKFHEGGYDMVIASRYLPGAKSEDDDAITAFGNWMFTKMINRAFSANYTDTLCMLRIWKKDLFYKSENMRVERAGLEPVFCIKAAKLKLKVGEVPGDEPARIAGVRKMSPLLNGIGILLTILLEYFSAD